MMTKPTDDDLYAVASAASSPARDRAEADARAARALHDAGIAFAIAALRDLAAAIPNSQMAQCMCISASAIEEYVRK